MVFIAEVKIELKKGMVDPEGNTAKKALTLLGYDNVLDVKSAKYFTLRINGSDKDEISNQVDSMCQRLLANPVVHNYTITVTEASA